MIRVHLPDDEADRLDRAFRTAADRKLRDRLQIVLMAHRGRPHGLGDHHSERRDG